MKQLESIINYYGRVWTVTVWEEGDTLPENHTSWVSWNSDTYKLNTVGKLVGYIQRMAKTTPGNGEYHIVLERTLNNTLEPTLYGA